MSTKTRGFGSMSKTRVKEIATMGGKRVHELGKAHKFTSEEARVAGKKGKRKPIHACTINHYF